MRNTIWSAVFMLLAAIPLAAQPMRGPAPGKRMMDRLELTESQKAKVEDLRVAHEKKMVQIEADLKEARIDVRSAMRNEKPDRTAVEKAIRNLADIQLQAKLEKTKFWFDMRGLLTPEQQAKMKDMPRMERRKMRSPHMPMMPGRGGCRCMPGGMDR